ncbi:MAG: prepilin peptidase [Bdellovibrionales bacterium]|nr:prepilin peptidase [Bdellovibrionales bacterium]
MPALNEPGVAFLVLVLGAIVGSFLNVVIHRVPLKQSVVRPGSRCPSCAAPIRWWQNVPILSFVLLRGRCSACRARISWRYPLVEAATALLFLLVWQAREGAPWLLLRDWGFVAFLVAVFFIDLDHRIIPNRLNVFAFAWGVPFSFLQGQEEGLSALAGAAVGFGVFFGFAWIYQFTTGRAGLGGGDIKFLGAAGPYLGVAGIFWVILVASVAGSLVGIGYALLSRRAGKRSAPLMRLALPFGPFLAAASIVYSLFGSDLWRPFMTPI